MKEMLLTSVILTRILYIAFKGLCSIEIPNVSACDAMLVLFGVSPEKPIS